MKDNFYYSDIIGRESIKYLYEQFGLQEKKSYFKFSK